MNYTESDFEAAYLLNRRACWILGALFVLVAVGYTIHYGSLPRTGDSIRESDQIDR